MFEQANVGSLRTVKLVFSLCEVSSLGLLCDGRALLDNFLHLQFHMASSLNSLTGLCIINALLLWIAALLWLKASTLMHINMSACVVITHLTAVSTQHKRRSLLVVYNAVPFAWGQKISTFMLYYYDSSNNVSRNYPYFILTFPLFWIWIDNIKMNCL